MIIRIIRFNMKRKLNNDTVSSLASYLLLLVLMYDFMTSHSEKFEMNEEVDSLLSEKVSNLLLT